MNLSPLCELISASYDRYRFLQPVSDASNIMHSHFEYIMQTHQCSATMRSHHSEPGFSLSAATVFRTPGVCIRGMWPHRVWTMATGGGGGIGGVRRRCWRHSRKRRRKKRGGRAGGRRRRRWLLVIIRASLPFTCRSGRGSLRNNKSVAGQRPGGGWSGVDGGRSPH